MTARLAAVSLALPSIRRGNDYYREHFPEQLAAFQADSYARFFAPNPAPERARFDKAMRPYLADPFRGARYRYAVAEGESHLDLQERAARTALSSVDLAVSDVDLLLCCSVWPRQLGFGDAAWVAGRLGLSVGSVNLEANSGAAPAVLDTATALVDSGRHRNVLVVFLTNYPAHFAPTDPLSWFVSDGAAACLISADLPGPRLCAISMRSTSMCTEVLLGQPGPDGRLRLSSGPGAHMMAQTAEHMLTTTTAESLGTLGLTTADVHTFLVNANTAGMADFAADALGVPTERVPDIFPLYSNFAVISPLAALVHAGEHIPPGAHVSMFASGVASVAASAVFEWAAPALTLTTGGT